MAVVADEILLMNYFISRVQYYKHEMLKPIKEDAGMYLFESPYKETFIDRAKWIVISDIFINLRFSLDSILNFMQTVNMEELLK